MSAFSPQLDRPLRSEAEARADIIALDRADPYWRLRHERKVNGFAGDSPEHFARRTRHLRTGSGQPLESVLLKLQAERSREP